MTRQRRTPRPNAPRMAPTAMKTVPSGALECFMKGAFLVGGTVGAGYVGIGRPGPVNVGKPVGPESSAVWEGGWVGAEDAEDAEDAELEEEEEPFFWASTGEASTAKAARVDKRLEARMLLGSIDCREWTPS